MKMYNKEFYKLCEEPGWLSGVTLGYWKFKSWQGLGIFLFTNMSRPVLVPTHPAIQ
jgi:hypothetical protein